MVSSEELWDQCKCWQPGNPQKPTNGVLLSFVFVKNHIEDILVSIIKPVPSAQGLGA